MLKIGVIGHSRREGEPSSVALSAAEEVGRGVAGAGAALVTGGTDGVMEHAAAGARAAGGLTVGFLPESDLSRANPHLDLAFPTGLGSLRNALVVRSCDALVVVGGGAGTLNEITLAYDAAVPTVVLTGTGGWADRLRGALLDGAFLDERRVLPVTFAAAPSEAVAAALARAREPRAARSPTGWTGA